MKLERHIKITGHDTKEEDKAYWKSKTPEERMAALEFLRQQYIKAYGLPQRLQRVYRVVERKKG